ncbi:peptidoglycan-binding protein [Streptomyces sp. Z26]|uniref:peptidoglycan-binding protein n=1 Tax=Streptomyces sp. Z26 TaxID=2500177 RepID=UPI000EF15EAA|nr:peptidoglycan-binding protein [Streptomyces sp. Z26]RLL70309.1 N-acetylmuramoyl-L-alanine amidase [Streptomyces sp. Z26]
MKLVRRSQWGAPATSAASSIGSTRGVKVHYLGSPYASRAHSGCDDAVRSIRASHLANRAEGYSDIAYNMLVCEHGYVFEGRGAHKKTGANGNSSLNSAHYAVCALLGSSGLTKPSDDMLAGIRDAIEWLREHGDAGNEIKGHRDGYATSCPGPALYAWVQKGAPRPGGTGGSTPPKPGPSSYEPFPGASFFMKDGRPALGKSSPIFTAMGKRLVAVGCGRYKVGPGPELGQADVYSYEAWQRECGYSGADAKWPPGKTTWDRLKVPNV